MTPERWRPVKAVLAGRYTIERELGHGGMATVYLARDRKHDRDVAVKVLDPALGAALGGERFLAEIRVTAALTHPNILPLFDSGEAGGLLYYAAPYVEGESLRAVLGRERQLPLADALRIAREVAQALDYAHRHGFVHRDVKPENVLLADGHAVVADFGIARAIGRSAHGGEGSLTATGIRLGTPAYMSPEQAAGERELDGRSDVYALGCVLYEVLAGVPPFAGATAESVLRQHVVAPAPAVTQLRPAVPAAVAEAIARAMAKEPADRFATAAAFADALAHAEQPAAVVPTRAARAGTWTLRAWQAAAVAALAVAAAFAVHAARREAPPAAVVVQRQLTFTGDVLNVGISPDGQWLAYVQDECARELLASCGHVVQVREVDGSQAVRIGRWPVVGPDVQWTGDGRVVFRVVSGRGEPDAVLVSDRLGGRLRRLGLAASAIAVLPDGRTLVAAVGPTWRQWLGRYDLSTLVPLDSVPLPPDVRVGSLSASPLDGTLAAVVTLRGIGVRLALLDRAGRLLDSVAVPVNQVVRWDSTATAVLAFDDALAGAVGEDLLRVPVVRHRFARVAPRVLVGQLPAFGRGRFDVARNGRLALVFGPATSSLELSPILAGGGRWRTVLDRTGFMGGVKMDFTPDGRGIILALSDNLGLNLYVAPLDGTPPRALTTYRGRAPDGPRGAQDATYSPDGTRLAFRRGGSIPTQRGVAVADSGGGHDRLVARSGTAPVWLDDRHIVVHHAGKLVAVDTAGATRDSVAVPDSIIPVWMHMRARTVERSVYYWSSAASALVAADFRTRATRVVARGRGSPLFPIGWDADGALLVAEENGGWTNVTLVHRIAPDGSIAPVMPLPRACRTPTVDRAGRWIACERVHAARDVWLAAAVPR